MIKGTKTWNPTKWTHLYRRPSGIYYARLSIGGKKTWRTLKTSTLSVAKVELEELLKDAQNAKEASQTGQLNNRITGGEAINVRKAQIENDPVMKKATRTFYRQIIAAFEKRWPEFLAMELRSVSAEDCQRWVGKNKATMSPSRFNCTLSLLRGVFEIAIKRGARRSNPAADLKKMKPSKKDLSDILPSRKQFAEWVGTIRRGTSRFSRHAADFVEFLAYTGMRTGEAGFVEWKHCDFETKTIRVVGDPEEATKNGEFRTVPMIPAMMELLSRIQKERGKTSPSTPVLRVNEAQHSMNRAFDELGMERFTHHDLRHYFATVCIESGVDIPTVAKWLGHKDGGALAMRTYGHLRNEHSLAAASKVSFAA